MCAVLHEDLFDADVSFQLFEINPRHRHHALLVSLAVGAAPCSS
jgi:hypothetical protein